MSMHPKPYKPTPEDIAWARQTLALLADGGTIVYPSAMMIYKVDKQRKTLTRIDLMGLPSESNEMHRRTKAVFAAVGYTVVDPSEN